MPGYRGNDIDVYSIEELEDVIEKEYYDFLALKEKTTVLEYLRNSKNTKPFADALLKDPSFITNLRTRIKKRLERTEEFIEMEKEGLNTDKIVKTVNNLMSASRALNFYKNKALRKHVNFISKNKKFRSIF